MISPFRGLSTSSVSRSTNPVSPSIVFPSIVSTTFVSTAILLLTLLLIASPLCGGAFVFAGESHGIDVITHIYGYAGGGGHYQVKVCIDPASPNSSAMVVPVQNIVDTFNRLSSIPENISWGASGVDFESVALHEVGHCIGLAHPNLGSQGQAISSEYTNTTDGLDNIYNALSDADGAAGSRDDVRGDDTNLHWFRRIDNDPFALGRRFDITTYALALTDLPTGHTFAANAGRDVASALGYSNTEAVMQQGTYASEYQRGLGADDEATLRLAMSGRDELQGTADDYTFELVYGGLTSGGSCNVTLEFDNSKTGFAVCSLSGTSFSSGHWRLLSGNAYFNTGYLWEFGSVRRQIHQDRFESSDLSGWD